MLSFGQRLKLIRKEAQITQAELSEKLMVSVQAISKWECDNTMPDISQIVPLAAILGVTTDCLLGVGGDEKADREKLYEEIRQIMYSIRYGMYTRENNAYYKCYELCKDHFKKYPLDYEVKLQCANTINHFIYDANRYSYRDTKEEEALYSEAIDLLTSIINYDRDTTRIIDAKETLIALYLYKEDFKKAEEEADGLPQRGSIRDSMLLEIYNKKADVDKCLEISNTISMEAVPHYLWSLMLRARRISIYGNSRKWEAIEAWNDLLEAAKFNHKIFKNKDIAWWIYKALNQMSNDYIAISEFDKAFETIEKLTSILIAHYIELKENGDTISANEMKDDFWFYLHWCYNKCFPNEDNIIAKDPRFKKCEERLAALD